jgi:hypothetical protein
VEYRNKHLFILSEQGNIFYLLFFIISCSFCFRIGTENRGSNVIFKFRVAVRSCAKCLFICLIEQMGSALHLSDAIWLIKTVSSIKCCFKDLLC